MKKNIKLPVVKGKSETFPSKPLCPWCKKNKVLEPHSMAIISGGALEQTGEDEFTGGANQKIRAYLNLMWHGAHDRGHGEDRDIGAVVDLADHVKGGVFDIIFCSTRCLRDFLNACVDELERKIDRERKKSNKRKDRTLQ